VRDRKNVLFLKHDPDLGFGYKNLICRIRIWPKMDRIHNPAIKQHSFKKLFNISIYYTSPLKSLKLSQEAKRSKRPYDISDGTRRSCLGNKTTSVLLSKKTEEG